MMGVGLGRKDILALVIIVSQLTSYILEKVKAREHCVSECLILKILFLEKF